LAKEGDTEEMAPFLIYRREGKYKGRGRRGFIVHKKRGEGPHFGRTTLKIFKLEDLKGIGGGG